MKEISAASITKTVARLCIEANMALPEGLCRAIGEAAAREQSVVGRVAFDAMLKNIGCAREDGLPLCQDTGMAVIFCEVGQEVNITGGGFEDAINGGVREGYTQGYLRASIVKDPFDRVNTGDNTPAVIHTRIVPGDGLTLDVAPKGFGSENMSAIRMFDPSARPEDIEAFIVESVVRAGGSPCPPVCVGVGLGGDFESCAIAAKRALLREAGSGNGDPFYDGMEKRTLAALNATGIGPQGMGGNVTALFVHIIPMPTHIAGLPCAVNIGCHITRHARAVL